MSLGRRAQPALISILALLAGCHSLSTAEDEVEILALLDRQVTAWNSGDIETFMAEGYLPSPELSFYSGDSITRGFDEVLARYRQRYLSEGAEMGQLTFADLTAELLGPDTALVRGRWRLDLSDGKTPNGLFSLILRRTTSGWRIAHDHTSSATPRD